MPRIGTPIRKTSSGARGVSAASTEAGPPENTTPAGSKARIFAASLLNGQISQ